MYGLADACLVTSTRDGMNLVSFTSILNILERFLEILVARGANISSEDGFRLKRRLGREKE